MKNLSINVEPTLEDLYQWAWQAKAGRNSAAGTSRSPHPREDVRKAALESLARFDELSDLMSIVLQDVSTNLLDKLNTDPDDYNIKFTFNWPERK